MGCGNCSGNCEHCGGCAGHLVVSPVEWKLLQKLGELPFLPVARSAGENKPIYFPETEDGEDYSLILTCLEKKGLITLDYDIPLKGTWDNRYDAYPIRGSMALTLRGQQVLDLVDKQGFEDA